MGVETRKRTDTLDAAGNTTAAVGKGFAIGSAALVAFALYGAFLTRSANFNLKWYITKVDIMNPYVFFGLLVGAVLPYVFSALCLRAVG